MTKSMIIKKQLKYHEHDHASKLQCLSIVSMSEKTQQRYWVLGGIQLKNVLVMVGEYNIKTKVQKDAGDLNIRYKKYQTKKEDSWWFPLEDRRPTGI